jgi:hypothetical protein
LTVALNQPRTSGLTALLPSFENLSRDPDNAYFTAGIQDKILSRLSKIAELKVISRISTQYYKSAPENCARLRDNSAWLASFSSQRDGAFLSKIDIRQKNIAGKGELYRVEDVMLSGGVLQTKSGTVLTPLEMPTPSPTPVTSAGERGAEPSAIPMSSPR